MKKTIAGIMMAVAAAANAGIWEGVKEENYVCGPQITERDMLGKVIVVFYCDDGENAAKYYERAEQLWKGHDKKRFMMVGSVVGMEKEPAAALAAKHKMTFPFYKGVKLASDSEKRPAGTMVVVNQYGKVVIGTGLHGGNSRDFEQFLVEAITEVGMPPNLMPGVTLEKYKSLKNKIKLGTNLKGVIKGLEKDVAAAEKKTATAVQKAKAEEASSILSAIKEGKSEIYENITMLTDVNPEAALKLLTQYVKSFPDEAADNKEKLAELKTKAAEFKKAAK